MTIKVLHVFPPNLKTRFGGQNITWKYNISKWDEPDIEHLVLDIEQKSILPACQAFNFTYPEVQKSTGRLSRLLWMIRLLLYVRKFHKDYDIIHVHILWWGSLLLAKWAKKNGIPSIYESVLLDADTPGSIKEEKLGGLKLRLLKSFTSILAISDYLAVDYKSNGFQNDQVVVLPNSVDTEIFHPLSSINERIALREKHQLPLDAIILIFVGSLIYRKGVDILLDGFIDISKQIKQATLLLVGPCRKDENPSLDEAFIADLRDKAEKLNIGSKVIFYGIQNDREILSELYRSSDIFTFLSRQEGLGNVVLEAMASGLPIVVSDLPVLKNIVSHRETGLLVPVADPQSFAELVLELISDSTLQEELRNNSREFIIRHHSFSNWQHQITRLYKDL